jgi:hypothetical protein
MESTVYFGRPGLLRKLYDPTGGILATRELASSVFQTGSGGARVQRALNGVRQYSLNYGALGRTNFDWLNNFQQGHMGPGPFVLLDPGRRNLLTVNQSSATSAIGGINDFTVSGAGGAIASDATQTVLLPNTLKWSFATTTPATALLTLAKPSTVWPGIPVLSPRTYTFWFSCLGGPINVVAQIVWYNLAGGVVSTTSSSAVTSSVTDWTRVSVSASPPSTALWATVQVAPVVATITSGESLYFNNFSFGEATAPEPWAGGTGVYPVMLLGMPEKYGFAEPGMLVSPTLVLQEVR